MPVSTLVSDPLSCVEVSYNPIVEILSSPENIGVSLNLVSSSSSLSSSSRNIANGSLYSISSASSPSSSPSVSSGVSQSEVDCSSSVSTVALLSLPGTTQESNFDGKKGTDIKSRVVKVEKSPLACNSKSDNEPDSSNIGDFDDDDLENVLNLSRDVCSKNDSCDLDLDFDDVDLDDDDITSRESGISCENHNAGNSCSSNCNVSLTSASSISLQCKSNCSQDCLHEDEDDQCSDVGDTETDDSNDQYLSIENPNAVPCLHCQGGKDHSNKEDLIWPIQLDLDLIETLFHLCPDFFDDFDEVEMDPMDLGATLSSIDQHLSESQDTSHSLSTSSSTSGNSLISAGPQPSPPNVQVDDSPLQPSMDRNKESLKVKLLLRRPMNQLVEQGILPPPKTPAAFAGQRVRLERARMGDLLKAKIQQRPARQELIRQHILEDSNARVAPSLAEKQRMLKRARLADSLNDHLIHRPGPLELVQKNILHAPDAFIEKAIKEGVVPFKATSEGHTPGPHVPNIYLGSEDESSSDLSSPAGTPDNANAPNELSASPPKSVDSSTSSQCQSQSQNTMQIPQPSPSLGSTTSSLSPLSVASTPPPPPPPPPPLPSQIQFQNNNFQIHLQGLAKIAPSNLASTQIISQQAQNSNSSQLHFSKLMENHHQLQLQNQLNSFSTHQLQSAVQQQQHHSTSKSRSSKKSSKTKSQPKARTIKFHEYKGPPNSQKGGNGGGLSSNLSQQQSQQQVESSYELLLQQQQLFLQWQLEWQHKYPQIILPAVSKLTSPTEATGKLASAVSAAAAAASISMHANPTVAAASVTSAAANVLTPSTVTSVISSSGISSNNSNPPVTTPGQKPIAPALDKTTTITIPHLTIAPASPAQQTVQPQISVQVPLTTVTVVSSSNSGQTEIRPKPPTVVNSVNSNSSVTKSEPNSNSSSQTGRLNINKLNDWKVSDLKAELKKRNLPVSGSKPQLIERLKTADSTVQDDNISTTTTNTKNNSGIIAVIKTENVVDETSSEMMETSGGDQYNRTQSDVKRENEQNSCSGGVNNNNSGTLNAAMLALLGKGVGVVPLPIINALAQQQQHNSQNIVVSDNTISASPSVGLNVNSPSCNSSATNSSLDNKTSASVVVVDETLIREQQRQIEQLQQALKMSQQQLQQMKLSQQVDVKNGGGQKHRLALQQHLQQKMQQQALQAQLQKLIQLHSIQQQQQQQKAIQVTVTPHSQTQIIQQRSSKVISTNQPQPITQNVGIEGDNSGKNKNELTTVTTVPFTIVKIATTTTTHLQTASSDQELTNIPQIQIPDDKNSAFQTDENESGQGSKENSTTDQMDHSWLLKINEAQPIDSKNGVKEFPHFFGTFITNEEQQQQQIVQEPKKNAVEVKSKKGFKSQMVDDVLEILIRNGELPPSAAQEPQTPTTPGKSPRILPYPTSATSTSSGIVNDSSDSIPPPPPPPLPPATFAITLPTSITFSRNPSANLPNFVPSTSVSGSGLNNSLSSPLLSIAVRNDKATDVSSTIPKSVTHLSAFNSNTALSSETLSKEAQDILKISEDLSNFGREHTEQETQHQMKMQNRMFHNHQQLQSTIHPSHNTNVSADEDSDTLAMLLGDVEKELSLDTDMDVVLDDSHHSSHDNNHNPNDRRINSTNLASNTFDNRATQNYPDQHNVQNFVHDHNSLVTVSVPMSVDNIGNNMIHIDIPNQSQNEVQSCTKMGTDDYLDELGTLLPGDLDVPMPMEMDYSDWLENLLPENSSNNLLITQQNTNNNVSNSITNANNNICNNVHHNSTQGFFGTNGSMMDFGNSSNQYNNSQRDPLLSSRSLDIFSANAVENNSSSGGIGLGLGIGTESGLKGSTGAPSPMAMSDSLLWDFAM